MKRKALLKAFIKKYADKKDYIGIDTTEPFQIGIVDPISEFYSVLIFVAEKNKKARPMCKKIEKLSKKIAKVRTEIEEEKKNPKKKVILQFSLKLKISRFTRRSSLSIISPEEMMLSSNSGQLHSRNNALVAAVAAIVNLIKCNLKSLSEICFSLPKSFKGKYLVIREAPDAQNVLWENLSLSTCSKLFRRLISIAITIALWILSKINYLEKNGLIVFICLIAFVVIILIKNEQVKVGPDVRPTEDCTSFSATMDVS